MATSAIKLRVLALHGYRQNDTVFSAKLGSLRKAFKQKIEFIFVAAPHKVPPLEEDPGDEAPNVDALGWWFNTEDRKFIAIEPSNLSGGFEESLTVIEKKFESDGPFDGILGFSQGASFVSILCAMQHLKLLKSFKFNFAIMISGFKSLCEPHAKYYHEKINLPSLHVYGETDGIIPKAMATELANLFINNYAVVHDGGHYVPGRKFYYNDFITTMHEIRNNSR